MKNPDKVLNDISGIIEEEYLIRDEREKYSRHIKNLITAAQRVPELEEEIKLLKEKPLYLVDHEGTHEISRIKLEIATFKQAQTWQPIESAKAHIRLFLANDTTVWIGRGGNIKGGYWFNDSGYSSPEPTHWMPLTSPPTDGESE